MQTTTVSPMRTDVSTLHDTVRSIDSDYVAVTTAWNDGQRGVKENGLLSALGGNITDSRIKGEVPIPYVRPQNMDELLGITTADKVCFGEIDGKPVTAQDVLENLETHAAYMGYTKVDTKVKKPKQRVVVRFQYAFVPLADGQTSHRIVPTHYSYQTFDRSDPRNLLVLGSAQGVFVHSDAPGENQLFAHTKKADGTVDEHFFVAEESAFAAGGAQEASGKEEERKDAKRARPVEMGLKGMGTRANCFVVMSVSNKQKPKAHFRGFSSWADADENDDNAPVYRSLADDDGLRSLGVARAACVSMDVDHVHGTAEKNVTAIDHPEAEPIVITILCYNTVRATSKDVSSVDISRDDVARTIEDMKRSYGLCDKVCRLSELGVMLHKLTKEDVATIAHKVKVDPPGAFDPWEPSPSAMARVVGVKTTAPA